MGVFYVPLQCSHLSFQFKTKQKNLKKKNYKMDGIKQDILNSVNVSCSPKTDKELADYIPGQFVAFSTTFGINTLSDIKTVDSKIQLKMVEAVKTKKDTAENVEILNKTVETVTAKKDTAETVEILNYAKKNIKIEQDTEKSSDEKTATITAGDGIKNNPNVYIPNQFQGYHGQSTGVNTVSQSATPMKSTTNTSETKKKKPQKEIEFPL